MEEGGGIENLEVRIEKKAGPCVQDPAFVCFIFPAVF